MSSKNELLDLVRRIRSDVEDIESAADEVEGNPKGAADDIRSFADDAQSKLRRLRTALEEMKE